MIDESSGHQTLKSKGAVQSSGPSFVQPQGSEKMSTLQAWLLCLTAGLFFFYEFVQLYMFNAIDRQLVIAFDLTSTQLGFLASASLIANVIFLIPAGLLLDRYSVRKLIFFTLGLCILGILLFSQAQTLRAAWCYRFLSGVGSAFCFLSCMRLASRWIHSRHLALATGLVVTMAMLGGMVAQTPLALLADQVGWRMAMLVNAALGVLFLILINLVVKDFPNENQQNKISSALKSLSMVRNFSMAFARQQNWQAALYTCLMNIPSMLLGAVWGVPYLQQVQSLSAIQASKVVSFLFIGTIVGSPLMGLWSDIWQRRRAPMLMGCLLSLMLILCIIQLPPGYFEALSMLFFLLGFFTSTQVLSYPIVSETNPGLITASAISVISLTTQGVGAASQSFFGWLLDLFSVGYQYNPFAFQMAILMIPAGFVVAGFAAFFLRESDQKGSL